MKRILFSVVFMVLIFTSTSAFADPANTRTYNWTGFYLGMQGSYDVGRSDQDAPLFGTHIDNNLKGVMGGFHIGYNYQTPVNVVVGIETDINAGRITGSSSCPNSSFS